jgi:hypothetical protein
MARPRWPALGFAARRVLEFGRSIPPVPKMIAVIPVPRTALAVRSGPLRPVPGNPAEKQ